MLTAIFCRIKLNWLAHKTCILPFLVCDNCLLQNDALILMEYVSEHGQEIQIQISQRF